VIHGRALLLFLSVTLGFSAAPTTAPGIPAGSGERLRYSVNWPSGLSLGELDISATRSSGDTGTSAKLTIDGALDASLPGFQITDHYESESTSDFCSTHFEKDFKHGARTNEEATTFDLANDTATRQTKTNGGGKSDLSTPHCAKDALAFLYFLRNELANGRLPQQQVVFFGAPYNVRLDYGGARQIRVGGVMTNTDRITAALHGPSSDLTIEIFFTQDAARTPVLVRVPVSVGTLTAELMK
jgi:hypothetical protein